MNNIVYFQTVLKRGSLQDEETESYDTDYSHLTEVGNDTSSMHDRGRYIIDIPTGKSFYVSNETFLFDRYDFLLNELFDEKNNLIVKYHIRLLLPNELIAYPDKLKVKAKEGLNLIQKTNIPEDAMGLEKRIKGNKELEAYLYEELKWERKVVNNKFRALGRLFKFRK